MITYRGLHANAPTQAYEMGGWRLTSQLLMSPDIDSRSAESASDLGFGGTHLAGSDSEVCPIPAWSWSCRTFCYPQAVDELNGWL